MELRVLVAVFVTLFGIAVGMADGDLSQQQVMTKISELRNAGDITQLLDFESRQQANTTITATVSTPESTSFELTRAADITLTTTAETNMTAGGATVTPRPGSQITVHGYTGSVTFNDGTLMIDGLTNAVTTDMLQFNYSSKKRLTIGDPQFQQLILNNMGGHSMTFATATGDITAGSTELSVTDEKSVFQSFEGEMIITANNDGETARYELDGKVFRAAIGAGDSQVVIGGN